jgi:hypothetical protein
VELEGSKRNAIEMAAELKMDGKEISLLEDNRDQDI